ncbi:MAG: glycosyltransferase [Muribaculaceae bacterium]|nr:glycosyltransferase [Muribaculaceae bacterium]
MNPVVSIIIPAYNSERTIERCVQSAITQSFEDIEVVVIDDGSTDNTLAILRNLESLEKRLKVISQPNQGVSVARNKGLEIAKGRFVTFVDSDDCLGSEYINEFFIQDIPIDTLSIQIPSKRTDGQGLDSADSSFHDRSYHETSIFDASRELRLLHNGYAHGKIYEREIIVEHGIRFNPAIQYKEDVLFLLDYLRYVKRIRISNGREYYYIQHPESLSTKWKDPAVVVKINELIELRLKEIPFDKKEIEDFRKFCFQEVIYLIYTSKSTGIFTVYKYLKLLRESSASKSLPITMKPDRILNFLFHNKLFVSFHLCKKILNHILKLRFK